MLIDSHCHLDFPDFAEEVETIVTRAQAAGVGLMLTIGTELGRFPGVLAVAERFEAVYCTVGVHPHEAQSDWGLDAARLVALADHPKVVGLGETGLDYYYDHSPRERQQDSFRAHITAARQTGLPLVIHTRDAEEDTIRILEEEAGQGSFPALIHCFSGSQRLADMALSLGFYISFSGVLTFKKAEEMRAIAARVPADRLLVETDSPYLAPVPKRGQRNEPAYVAYTAATLAAAQGVGAGEIARVTTENFFRLFTKVPRPAAMTAAA